MLNLPDTIQFTNGNQIINTYDASGRKLKAEYLTSVYGVNVPVSSPRPLQDNQVKYYSATLYNGNIEYEADRNNNLALNRIHNTEGYVDSIVNSRGKYNYFRKDHLGSNREVWRVSGTTAQTIQRTQYYPSGLPWLEESRRGEISSSQPNRYNGKEYIEDHGWDMTDLGNRGIYHAINQFTSIDRFAEKYPWQSPYVHAGNNPINYVDVNGDSIKFYIWEGDNDNLQRRQVSFSQLDKNIQKALVSIGKSSAGYNFLKQFAAERESFDSEDAGGFVSFFEKGENSQHDFHFEQNSIEGGHYGEAGAGFGGNKNLWFLARVNTERKGDKNVEDYASAILHEMFIHLYPHVDKMMSAFDVSGKEFLNYRSNVFFKSVEKDHADYINKGDSYNLIRSIFKQNPQWDNNALKRHDNKYNYLKTK